MTLVCKNNLFNTSLTEKPHKLVYKFDSHVYMWFLNNSHYVSHIMCSACHFIYVHFSCIKIHKMFTFKSQSTASNQSLQLLYHIDDISDISKKAYFDIIITILTLYCHTVQP